MLSTALGDSFGLRQTVLIGRHGRRAPALREPSPSQTVIRVQAPNRSSVSHAQARGDFVYGDVRVREQGLGHL